MHSRSIRQSFVRSSKQSVASFPLSKRNGTTARGTGTDQKGRPTLVLAIVLGVTVLNADAQPRPHYAYCGRSFKSLLLFERPDFKSNATSPLACGQKISVVSEHGSWAKIRVRSGQIGYEPLWFVGPPRVTTVSSPTKCNRPSPLGNIDQFDSLQRALDHFIDDEKFTAEDLQSLSREDTEKLAASSYFAAYVTADNPGLVKDAISKAVADNRVFGKDFANLPAAQQIAIEIWLQKILDVLSKAVDLGFKDGSKYPCSPKQPPAR